MKKASLLKMAALSAALIGCTDENIVDSKDVKSVAKATFTVTEVKTGKALDSAVVIVDGVKTSDTLTKSGVLQLNNLPVGTYTVHIRKAGYAELQFPVTIEMAAVDETPVANDLSEQVTMYPVSESNAVEGAVRVYDKNNQFINSDKVPVKLEFADSHLKEKVIYASTDSKGAFIFKSLPAYAGATLSFLPYTAGGSVYVNSSTRAIEVLKDASLKIAEPFNYSYDAAALKLLSSNVLAAVSLADTVPVQLVFSEQIDTLRSKKTISVTGPNGEYAAVMTFKGDTVNFSPLGGRWSAGSNTIQFGAGIYSMTGKTYATNVNFTVGRSGALTSDLKLALDSVGALPVADTNKISENTSTFSLKWDKDANAESYVVYRKASDERNFTLQAGLSFDGDSTKGRINSGTIFDDGKSYKYLLVAKNSQGIAALDESKALEIKDVTAPYTNSMNWSWTSGSSNQYSGTVNGMSTLNDTTNAGSGADRSQYLMNVDTLNQNSVPSFVDSNLVATINFSENMDTRITPTITGVGSYATPVWVWDPNNKNVARLYLKYTVGKELYSAVGTVNTIALSVDFSSLKDLMGNSFSEKARVNSYRNAYAQQWTTSGMRTWKIKPAYSNSNNQGL